MSISISTIRTRLENRLGDIADFDVSLYQVATDLNQFLYREMMKYDPQRFITSPVSAYSITTSPSTQALPADFNDIKEYGTGFFIRNQDGTDSTRQLRLTGFGSTDEGYYISGTNVVFTGINTSTTVVLKYIPTLTDLSDLSHTFVVPDGYKELVLEGMVLYYYRYNEDVREADQDQRFKRLFDQFVDDMPKAPRIYTLASPFSNAQPPYTNIAWPILF